jgi:hypothetical protein
VTVTPRRGICALMVVALGCAVCTGWAPWRPIHVSAGLLLVFLLPGLLASYVIAPAPVESARFRLVLAVALSITVTILVGSLEAAAADAITGRASAVIWFVVCAISGTAGIARANREIRSQHSAWPYLPVWRALVFPIVGLLLLVALSANFLVDYRDPQYTELGIVSRRGRTIALVTNRNDSPRTYLYELLANGDVIKRGRVRIGSGRSAVIPFGNVPYGSFVRANVATVNGDEARSSSYVASLGPDSTSRLSVQFERTSAA